VAVLLGNSRARLLEETDQNVQQYVGFASGGTSIRPGRFPRSPSAELGSDYGYSIWTTAMTEIWYRSFIDTLPQSDQRVRTKSYNRGVRRSSRRFAICWPSRRPASRHLRKPVR
jgi:hypothetical protein